MRQRVDGARRAGGPDDVGVDVPLRVRAHPAGATQIVLGYPRQFSIYDQADAARLTGYVVRDLGLDAKRFAPRAVHGTISRWKNELVDPVRAAATAQHIFERKHAEVYAEYQKRLRRGRRDGLRRPAREHRHAAPRPPRRARAVPPALRAHPRRRVPGHQPGPERDRAPARRRPPQRHRRRRHRPVGLPLSRRRLPQHPPVRGGVRRLPASRRRARSELPQHADDPRRRQRGHRQQPARKPEGPVDRRRPRRPRSCATTPRTRATRPVRRRHRPRPPRTRTR